MVFLCRPQSEVLTSFLYVTYISLMFLVYNKDPKYREM